VVDVGLLHLAEELARVGRKRLDVAALAFGVNRVNASSFAGPDSPVITTSWSRGIVTSTSLRLCSRIADDDGVLRHGWPPWNEYGSGLGLTFNSVSWRLSVTGARDPACQ
jgi:hypothetical protein